MVTRSAEVSLRESEKIVDHVVADKTPDRVITYEDFEEILGRDLRLDRDPLYDAIKVLETKHQCTLVNVYCVGYRIAHPGEVSGLVTNRIRCAKRQFVKGKRTGRSANLSECTPEQRVQHDNVMFRLSAMQSQINSIERHQARQDRRTDRHELRITRLEEQLTPKESRRLLELLEKLEQAQ